MSAAVTAVWFVVKEDGPAVGPFTRMPMDEFLPKNGDHLIRVACADWTEQMSNLTGAPIGAFK